MDQEDTFGYTLRQWLVHMINCNRFPGLEWITQDTCLCPEAEYWNFASEHYLRIPWNRQGKSPNWEEEYELFRAWARHRGSYNENEKPDWTKLKSNFRSVLSKSNDFEEIKQAQVLDQQTGNFRVFRLKRSAEVKAEAAKRKKKRSDEGYSGSENMNQSPHSQISCTSNQSDANLELGNVSFDTPDVSQQPASIGLSLSISPSSSLEMFESSQPLATIDVLLNSLSSDLHTTSYNPSNTDGLRQETPQFQQVQFVSRPQMSFVSEATTSGYGTMLQSPDIATTPLRNDQASVFLPPNIVEVPEKRIQQMLQFCSAASERFLYEVTVRYCGVTYYVNSFDLRPKVTGERNGVRLLYGDDQIQTVSIVVERELPDEFRFHGVSLPKSESDNAKIDKVLQGMGQGFAIWTDNEGNLYGNRLCQSHAFLYAQETATTATEPMKMARKTPSKLFSYRDYVTTMVHNKLSRQEQTPSSETTIYFGARPKSRESLGLVTVSFTPRLVTLFGGNCDSSVGMSTSDSIDFILRNGVERMDIK